MENACAFLLHRREAEPTAEAEKTKPIKHKQMKHKRLTKHLATLLALTTLLLTLPMAMRAQDSEYRNGDYFTATTVENVTLMFEVINASEKTCQVAYRSWHHYYAILKNYQGTLTIPESVNGFTVVAIDGFSFYECTGLTSITLPESLRTFGGYAFYGCI